ncbi:unnamed protein product [Rhizophagus irregularis]|nr:unnamed protein product [Rhizophagus irregularis]
MEEKLGQGLQMKSQQELFERTIITNLKAVHFEPTTNTSSTQQWDNVPVDKELYFDATDNQKLNQHQHILEIVKRLLKNLQFEWRFQQEITMKPLLSTKPKEDNVSSDDSDETKEK